MLREDIGKILSIDVVEYGRICRERDIEVKPCLIRRSLPRKGGWERSVASRL